MTYITSEFLDSRIQNDLICDVIISEFWIYSISMCSSCLFMSIEHTKCCGEVTAPYSENNFRLKHYEHWALVLCRRRSIEIDSRNFQNAAKTTTLTLEVEIQKRTSSVSQAKSIAGKEIVRISPFRLKFGCTEINWPSAWLVLTVSSCVFKRS